ncbi:hypothetical protein EDD22DRAFT_845150 [Suillus occidentalis]|nr:hypothetical protein EDD22DRAFT_845150 [Suillus occidentalis]
MALPVAKKKGRGKVAPQQLERNLSVIQETSKSGPTTAGPTPSLYMIDQGSLISMIVVPLKELLMVVLMVVLVVVLVMVLTVVLAASLKMSLFVTLRLMESEFWLSVLAPCLMLFLSLSSPSQDMFVDGTEEGNEEVNEEADFDKDNIYYEGEGFTEDDGIDNDMEYKEGFHGGSDNMHLSDHNNQTYPGNNQVRQPTQAPDRGAYLQDENFDDTGVAGMDRNHRNDHTTGRRGKDHHINVAQAPK